MPFRIERSHRIRDVCSLSPADTIEWRCSAKRLLRIINEWIIAAPRAIAIGLPTTPDAYNGPSAPDTVCHDSAADGTRRAEYQQVPRYHHQA